MSRINQYLLGAFALVLLASSCDEDSFGQTVEIPLPDHESLPTISLDLRAGDTLLTPAISRSFGLLDDLPEGDGPNVLELYRNDELIGRMETGFWEPGQPRPEIRLAEPLSDEPAVFRLEGTVPGYGIATATQAMPDKAVFEVTNYEPNGGVDSEGFEVDNLDFTIMDDPAVENFYAIRVIIPSTFCEIVEDSVVCRSDFNFVNYAYIESPDPLLQDAEQYGLVISDQSFNGQNYSIDLRVDNYQDGPIRFEVINFTEDGYRYAISRAAYQRARDNPFAEPVNVHENVEGGYGYFILGNGRFVELE